MRYSAGYARVVAAAIEALASQISVIGPAMQRHALEQDDMDSGHKSKKPHAIPGVCVKTEEARCVRDNRGSTRLNTTQVYGRWGDGIVRADECGFAIGQVCELADWERTAERCFWWR